MTNKDLADLIFPNLEHDVDYYESLYPERELKEGEKVTRFAPRDRKSTRLNSSHNR